jgi:2-deoxy-D-gluconate 3-dehydrogenase
MKPIKEIFNLHGKGAVVTGGAMGIGLGISKRLAEAGASVMIADIRLDEAQAAADEIKKSGLKAEAIKVNVANPADTAAMIAACVKQFGNVNIMVNNAGIFPFAPSDSMTEAQWDRVQDINLKGTFFAAQAAAKAMKESGGGKIVNIASIDSLHPTGNLAHYDASKGGVLMLTRSLAVEWAPFGITVNAVLPGGIGTPGTAAISEGMLAAGMTQEQLMQAFTARIPLKRMGEPDDIAKVVLFLASDASDYMTGSHIVVDGGYLLS